MALDTEIRSRKIIEIPIFPLPNVVFFPNTILPLHIFEPRYRHMTADALEGNRRIGICLLKFGREDPTQPLEDAYWIGGLGVIDEVRHYPDGRYDLTLAGRSRYRLLALTATRPYRRATVEVLRETRLSDDTAVAMTGRLLETYSELATFRQDTSQLEALGKLDFNSLINLICMSLNIGVHSKQSLLEIDDLQKRGRTVLQLLQSLIQQERVVRAFSHLRPGDPVEN